MVRWPLAGHQRSPWHRFVYPADRVHVPRSQEACDTCPRRAAPAQIKKKREVTHYRAIERDLSQRSLQGRDECLETPVDVLVHAADMMRD